MISQTETAPHSVSFSLQGLRDLAARGWQTDRLLTLSVLLYVTLIPVFIVAIWADPRVITGAPAWVKPLKFAVSSAIYVGTFLWLLTFVQGRARVVRLVAALVALSFLIENGLIGMQTLRGTTSHFNISSPFDAAVFSLMGGVITMLAVLNLLLGIWLFRSAIPDRAVAWAVRLGVLIAFVGMMTGFLMTSIPTPAQQAQMAAGRAPTTFGAHSIGVEDGGPGLPLVGWSTAGGDLRVAHFTGLHAMQVLPLLAWWLTRPALRRRTSAAQRTGYVLISGAAYLGLVVLLTVQALRGQSVIAPDGWTLAGFAALVGVTVSAVAVVARRVVAGQATR